MAVLSQPPGRWKKADGSLTPIDSPKNITLAKTDPEIKLTDTGNSEYTRITKADTSNVAQRFNRVAKPGGAIAVSFNAGTIDFINIPDSASLSPTSTAAFEAWIYKNVAGNQYIATKGVFGTSLTWAFRTVGTILRVYIATSLSDGGTTYGDTASAFSNNTWTHIKFVFNGAGATNADRLKIYVNNINQSISFTGTIPSSLTDSSTALQIGASNGGATWDGYIDEIIYFNTNDSSNGYNGGVGVYHSAGAGIVGLWHLDENIGTSVADSSGNSNTGTFNGTPTWATGLVGGPASTIEANIWKSQDGVAASEGGILTIGEGTNIGTTILNGGNIRFQINDTEVERFKEGGVLALGTTSPTTTATGSLHLLGSLSIGNSASNPAAGLVISKQNTIARGFYYMDTTAYAVVGGSIVNDIRFTVNNTNRFYVDKNDNVACGQSVANLTTAINGFLYIPSTAGTPTGVPATTYTGKIPYEYDSTNNIPYYYNSGWKSIYNTANDIEVNDTTKGLILKSPDSTRWRITVNNDGTLTTTSL